MSSSLNVKADYRSLVERIIVEIADYLARLELLLTTYRARFGRNDLPIVAHINQYIDTQMRAQLALHVQAYAAKRDGDSDSPSLARTAYRACTIRSRLEDVHGALKHLDIPTSLPETATFVGRAWNILRSSRLGEISNLDRSPPAISLSYLLDPSEHVLGSRGSSAAMSVVALAKVDYANPRAWVLLLHELGHRAIREFSIPTDTDTDDDIIRQWVIEIGCDIIGLRLAGPAYFSAFMSRVLVDDAFAISTPRHPAPVYRARAILDHLPDWLSKDRIIEFNLLLQAREMAARAQQPSELIPDEAICKACKQSIAKVVRGKIGQIEQPLASLVAALSAKFNLPSYPVAKFALAEHLATELQQGIIVGGVRNVSNARSVLSTIGTERNASTARVVADIAQELCDQPTDAFDILNAADIAFSNRTEKIALLIEAARHNLKGSGWRDYVAIVKQQDDLVVASLETASFSYAIRGLSTHVE